MSDVLNNPVIAEVISTRETRDYILRYLVDQQIATRKWSEMPKETREACVRRMTNLSNTVEELRQQLTGVGCIDCAISWNDVDPTDKKGLEAQALVKALGGLVAKNGALVSVMTADEEF